MDELSQLDELIESDILEALGQEKTESTEEENIETNNDEISIEDFNDDIEETEIDIKDFDEEIEESKINIEDFDEETTNIETPEETIIEDFDEETPEETIFEEKNEIVLEDESKEEDTISEDAITSTLKTDDLASLLSQLLKNKTIEITIKIKD